MLGICNNSLKRKKREGDGNEGSVDGDVNMMRRIEREENKAINTAVWGRRKKRGM